MAEIKAPVLASQLASSAYRKCVKLCFLSAVPAQQLQMNETTFHKPNAAFVLCERGLSLAAAWHRKRKNQAEDVEHVTVSR